jgi:putative cell wall-binding protein
VVGGSQDVTRPQVVVDETNARAYVLFTAPENGTPAGNDQTIYYKSAPLSTLTFNSAGLGTAFIKDGVNDISNVSTSKQGVTAASGLMAIASSDTNTSYYHGFLSLGPTANREVVRVSGPNRYATAAEVSKVRFPAPGANFAEVFVATGANFPDALSAGPAANLVGAPILLVSKDTIPAETQTELTRLGPAKITIVGGTSQVSTAVETQLHAYAATVERIAGTNRYDTAEQVSLRFAVNRPAVFIASGTGFPDALSAGPAASLLNVPILLTERDVLPNDTKTALTRLDPATIYVVGGTGVVSDAVKAALVPYTDGGTAGDVIRLSGADRFATNVAVVQEFWTTTVARSAVANGLNFPDALAEGAYDLPLHLVTPTSVPSVVAADIQRIDPDRIDALGGTTQISDGVLNTLRAL